jgi:hypothetical protein
MSFLELVRIFRTTLTDLKEAEGYYFLRYYLSSSFALFLTGKGS